MDPLRPLAPCFIGQGTLTNPRDMLRAIETLENVAYRFLVDGETVAEGNAALVKLMADEESATLIVNGCLFLNIASFRFLDFQRAEDEQWRFMLHADSGTDLELIALPDTDEESSSGRPHLLSEEITSPFDVLITLDEDDDEE